MFYRGKRRFNTSFTVVNVGLIGAFTVVNVGLIGKHLYIATIIVNPLY
jgi:hypothetical protein